MGPNTRVTSFVRNKSRIPPAVHSLESWHNAPTTAAIKRDATSGACILPGPFCEIINRPGTAITKIKRRICNAGAMPPSTRCFFSALPREYPFLRYSVPIYIPATKPKRAIIAFISPPPKRINILSGQPRNTRAHIITIAPSTKRVSGLDPLFGLNSPLIRATIKLPRTRPMISGLIY